ncbi:hypothetical protein MMPV_000293 [Pyropia vietnamensis]
MRRPAQVTIAAVAVAVTAAVTVALGSAISADAAEADGLVANLGGVYTRSAGAPAACPPTVVHSASRAGLQPGIYYIDHANITANGTACAVGGRATLFEPSLLANKTAITDLEASARNDAVALLGNPVAAAIMTALRGAGGGNEWLGGYEEQERVCGGYRWPAAITFLLYTDGVSATDVGFSTDEGGMVVILPGNATCVYTIDEADREGVPHLPAVGGTDEPEEPVESDEPTSPSSPSPAPSPTPSPTTSVAADNDGATCFPADAVVDTPRGPVRVDALVVGDEVAAPGGGTSTVFLFTHASPPHADRHHVYVELAAADGRTLTVTPSHYVYVDGGRRVPAGSVAVGDALDDAAGACVPVVGVRRLAAPRGLYNPQTLGGDLVVSGFRVSTYTTAIEPATAHGLLAPVRGVWRLATGLAGLASA